MKRFHQVQVSLLKNNKLKIIYRGKYTKTFNSQAPFLDVVTYAQNKVSKLRSYGITCYTSINRTEKSACINLLNSKIYVDVLIDEYIQ